MTIVKQLNKPGYCDGYALVETDAEGNTVVKPIKSKAKQTAGNYCYKLPENEYGLKWLSDSKICDGYELGSKTTKTAMTTTAAPRKSEIDRLREVLNEEDRATLDALVKKAIAKLKKAQLEEQIARLKEQLAQYEE